MGLLGKSRSSGKNSEKQEKTVSFSYNKWEDIANGAPMDYKKVPPQEPGCRIHDEFNKDRHVYSQFGKPQERCIKCGKEHSMITMWRNKIMENLEADIKTFESHPFVKYGFWSMAEYRKYLKK